MKVKRLFSSLLVFLAASCGQDHLPGGGDYMRFSVETGYNSSTKTAYAGGTVADGAKERINWVKGDPHPHITQGYSVHRPDIWK